MKTFSEKFEQNANLQLRKVTRAIDLYVKNVYIKSRLVRYVNSQNGFGMMQPLSAIAHYNSPYTQGKAVTYIPQMFIAITSAVIAILKKYKNNDL